MKAVGGAAGIAARVARDPVPSGPRGARQYRVCLLFSKMGPRSKCEGSVECGRSGYHRQDPHRTRTTPVQAVVNQRAMKPGAPESFGAQLKALREAAGFTQEELATIAGLSVHAVSALERGQRRRPHVDTVRALSAALDLTGTDARRARQECAGRCAHRGSRSTARRHAASGSYGPARPRC